METKQVKGYENYSVTSNGDIISNPRLGTIGGVLKPSRHPSGKMQVCLSRDGKQKRVTIARVVAEAFVPNPANKQSVYHINGNKEDNRVSNLTWADNKEIGAIYMKVNDQLSRAAAKLSDSEVREARKMALEGVKQDDIADKLGVHKSGISKLLRGKTYTNIKN